MVKRVKVFQATWQPADGVILVVLAKEADGSWRAYFTTDLAKTAAEVLQAVADRGAIEQCFRGLKEVLGAAPQQLRRLDRNVGPSTGTYGPARCLGGGRGAGRIASWWTAAPRGGTARTGGPRRRICGGRCSGKCWK